MGPAGRKLQRSLDKKKSITVFFERGDGMLLYQFYLIDPIRLLGGFFFPPPETDFVPRFSTSKFTQTKVYFGFDKRFQIYFKTPADNNWRFPQRAII